MKKIAILAMLAICVMTSAALALSVEEAKILQKVEEIVSKEFNINPNAFHLPWVSVPQGITRTHLDIEIDIFLEGTFAVTSSRGIAISGDWTTWKYKVIKTR